MVVKARGLCVRLSLVGPTNIGVASLLYSLKSSQYSGDLNNGNILITNFYLPGIQMSGIQIPIVIRYSLFSITLLQCSIQQQCHSQLKELRMRRSLVKFSMLVKTVNQNVDRMSKKDKSCHICSVQLNGILVKYGTLSMYLPCFVNPVETPMDDEIWSIWRTRRKSFAYVGQRFLVNSGRVALKS